jgi:UDP-galactopyranose mutase
MARVLIVGAGLTGCTLAHRLARDGVESVLVERAEVPGGLIRSEHMNGVLYEPHGSHIFHTEDVETERDRDLNDRYQDFVREEVGVERTVFAGRLANYLYIDMDDCMRQALDAAEGEVLPALRSATP